MKIEPNLTVSEVRTWTLSMRESGYSINFSFVGPRIYGTEGLSSTCVIEYFQGQLLNGKMHVQVCVDDADKSMAQ